VGGGRFFSAWQILKRQGSGKPPNAKAVSNDKAKANARPSQTATVRGKPSGPGMGCPAYFVNATVLPPFLY
jgi:hypothetical protein